MTFSSNFRHIKKHVLKYFVLFKTSYTDREVYTPYPNYIAL